MSLPDADPAALVYFGESLGSGVAVALAAEAAPAALVLRSPFTSMVDVGRRHYPFLPVGLLLRDRFPTLERIRKVHCPLLVVAGVGELATPGSTEFISLCLTLALLVGLIQIGMAIVLLVIIVAFEIDMRLHGWEDRAAGEVGGTASPVVSERPTF